MPGFSTWFNRSTHVTWILSDSSTRCAYTRHRISLYLHVHFGFAQLKRVPDVNGRRALVRMRVEIRANGFSCFSQRIAPPHVSLPDGIGLTVWYIFYVCKNAHALCYWRVYEHLACAQTSACFFPDTRNLWAHSFWGVNIILCAWCKPQRTGKFIRTQFGFENGYYICNAGCVQIVWWKIVRVICYFINSFVYIGCTHTRTRHVYMYVLCIMAKMVLTR